MKQVILPEISEESLATTLEIISDGIWDWNANTGYVYRSPAWYMMLGYEFMLLLPNTPIEKAQKLEF